MELGAVILDSTDEDRCEFCLKLPEEEQQIVVPSAEEVTIRGTIEFVLGVSIESAGSKATAALHCCLTCWVTFESFYDFKSNCLTSMKARRKILQDLKQEVKVEVVERPTVVSAPVFECQRCQEKCSSQAELDEHVTRYCFESSDSVEEVEVENPPQPQPTEYIEDIKGSSDDEFWQGDRVQKRVFPNNFVFCCARCNKLFKGRDYLQKHKEKCTAPRKVWHPKEVEPNENGVREYRCELCECSYNKARLLEFHMHKHFDEPEWVCREGCNRSFYFPSNRTGHEKECNGRHRVKPERRLPVKKRKLPQANKPRKMKFDYPTGYVWCCPACKTKFSSLDSLNEHKKACRAPKGKDDHKPDAEGKYTCTLCGCQYKSPGLIRDHMYRHYDERAYMCRVRDDCTRAFFSVALRKLHENDCQKDTGYICNVCGEQLKSRDTLRVHMRGHGGVRHECMICGKTFKSRNNFTSHWWRHFSIRGDPNPVTNPESNLTHVERLPRNIVCELCQKALPSHGIYARHRRYCNQPAPPKPENSVQCPDCPKCFVSQERFEEHRNMHLGIRNVPCRVEGCTAKFVTKHVRRAHELNCGKQWVCNVCGLVFKHRNTLTYHLETHSDKPPTCEICSKTFSSSKALKVHVLSHTKEKNYACPICDRRFTQNSSVKTHLKTHSVEETQGIDLRQVFHAPDI